MYGYGFIAEGNGVHHFTHFTDAQGKGCHGRRGSSEGEATIHSHAMPVLRTTVIGGGTNPSR
jgi:hypothetical protein